VGTLSQNSPKRISREGRRVEPHLGILRRFGTMTRHIVGHTGKTSRNLEPLEMVGNLAPRVKRPQIPCHRHVVKILHHWSQELGHHILPTLTSFALVAHKALVNAKVRCDSIPSTHGFTQESAIEIFPLVVF
jgi:hypothetical protein